MPGVEKGVREWHPQLARSFERYASVRTRRRRAKKDHVRAEPHWLLLPQWLMRHHRQKDKASKKFLADIVRGQFCAFLAIKLQDDLFDGHVSDRSLIYAADHLLLSARTSFAPYFPTRSAFWTFFDSSIRRTVNAIIDWDDCQLHGFGPASSVKGMTSAGYAVCNLGTFAVCLRLKKPRLYRALLPWTDELAYVGQLLDDLEDMQEDFLQGRLNYAARFLLGRPTNSRTEIAQQLATAILFDGKLGEFLKMLEGRLSRAAGIARSIGLPPLLEFIHEYQGMLGSMEKKNHQRRVRAIFEHVDSIRAHHTRADRC